MLITQYKAAKTAQVTRQTIHEQSRKLPRPGYFIDTGKVLMVDDQHPEWQMYIKNRKLSGRIKNTEQEKSAVMKFLQIVDKVLTDRYGSEEAAEIKQLIIQEARK